MGLTLAGDDYARDAIARGELVSVLEEFSTPFPGFYLYYPQRRNAARAASFVDSCVGQSDRRGVSCVAGRGLATC